MDYLLLCTHKEWIVSPVPISTLDCNACLNGSPRVKNMAHPECEIKAKGTHIE